MIIKAHPCCHQYETPIAQPLDPVLTSLVRVAASRTCNPIDHNVVAYRRKELAFHSATRPVKLDSENRIGQQGGPEQYYQTQGTRPI